MLAMVSFRPSARAQIQRTHAIGPFSLESLVRALTSLPTTDNLFGVKTGTSMLEVIEKLLILQDRDRKILRTKDQLAHIPHERYELQGKLSSTQAQLDSARLRVKQIESDRKKLELDVDAKKQ